MSAATVPVDLSGTPDQINNANQVTYGYASGELTVNFDFDTQLENPYGGVEFPLNDIQLVTAINFDYIGFAYDGGWVSLIVYLKDENGKRWVAPDNATLNLANKTEWGSKINYVVTDGLWGDVVSGKIGQRKVVAIGFMVNPDKGCAGSLGIRNVSLSTSGDAPTPAGEDIVVDLSTAVDANTDFPSTWILNDKELTVTYDFSGAADNSWPNGGVEFPLDNVENVKAMSFEYKGDAAISQWTSFMAYLKDSEGVRWFNKAADLSLDGITTWQRKEYMPEDELWNTTATWKSGDKPFVAIGFLANPGNADKATFCLRNVKIILNSATGLKDVMMHQKASKFMMNGRMMIKHGNRIFNAMGAEL